MGRNKEKEIKYGGGTGRLCSSVTAQSGARGKWLGAIFYPCSLCPPQSSDSVNSLKIHTWLEISTSAYVLVSRQCLESITTLPIISYAIFWLQTSPFWSELFHLENLYIPSEKELEFSAVNSNNADMLGKRGVWKQGRANMGQGPPAAL